MPIWLCSQPKKKHLDSRWTPENHLDSGGVHLEYVGQGKVLGKAHGDTFNMGDVNAVWDDMNVFSDNPAEKPVPGKIHTYVSDLNASEIDISQSSFVIKVHDINKCQTIQEIVRRSSEDYSPIRHKLLYIFW